MITPHIQRIKPLSDLPNQAGFKFIGITNDHRRIDCKLRFPFGDNTKVIRGTTSEDKLIGWVNVCH